MKRYRVLEKEYASGRKDFTPQYRGWSTFWIWDNFYYIDRLVSLINIEHGLIRKDSLEAAEEVIRQFKIQKLNEKVEKMKSWM